MKSEQVIASVLIIIFLGFLAFLLMPKNKASKNTSNLYSSESSSRSSASSSRKSSATPSMQVDEEKRYTAVLTTTEGKITIELNARQTPITVNNFVTLARKNFYNNTIFHRVIKGFMIQGGDPEGTGRGGPGYRFEDEPFEGEYTRGTIAMANAGPDTNGSQFFIMHKDAPLPKDYTIFGKVTEGIEVVDKIAEAPVEESDSGEASKPVNPSKVLSVEIIEE